MFFQKIFFFDEKKKLRKKMDHHINVEFCKESISDVFRAIGALLRPLERNSLLFSQFATGPWESENHLVKWPDIGLRKLRFERSNS